MEQLIHISIHDDYYVSHSSVIIKDLSENIFLYFDKNIFGDIVVPLSAFINALSDTLCVVSCINNWETHTQKSNIAYHIADMFDLLHITNIEKYLIDIIENLLPPQNIVAIDLISIYDISNINHIFNGK